MAGEQIVSIMLPTGSTQLVEYLASHTVGNTVPSPDGKTLWTILEVNIDESIPPNPVTKAMVTKVDLIVGAEGTLAFVPPEPILQ